MAEKEYIERGNYCRNICRCNAELCDKSKCPLMTAPAADVAEVVHGEWTVFSDDIAEKVNFARRFAHMECGCITPFKSRYCPYCGAKMDSERKEDTP